MAIEVISNTEPVVQAEKLGAEAGTSASELAANAAEQTPAKSDLANTEAEDESDSEDAEDEGDESESNAEKDKPKRKSGAVRRRERAERDAAEIARARAEADHWRMMALKGADASKPETDVETPAKSDPAGKPSPDSFETHAEYVEALTDWKIEERERVARETAARSKLETEQKSLMSAHSERVKSFAEKTEDFQDVLRSVDDVRISPTVAELLVSSDNGPELMYELAKNRAEYERINALNPLAAARELGKLDAKLAAIKAPASEPKEPKTITKAPKPIAPVSGKGGVVEKSIHDPNLSQREYEALRAKQRSVS